LFSNILDIIMPQRELSIETEELINNSFRLIVKLGRFHFSDEVALECPNQKKGEKLHVFHKNGHDTKVKGNLQQFRCETCGTSFYLRTSKAVRDFEENLKILIKSQLIGGKLKLKNLAARLHTNKTTAGRIMAHILEQIHALVKEGQLYNKKRRKSANLFVDETFIKIYHVTWYLIVVVSGNNKVMAVHLVEHRDEGTLLKIIHECQQRLCFPLCLLITDGLMAYRGVALALGIPLTHLRHIHKPPYGRIEVEIYSYEQGSIIRTILKTTNEIVVKSGVFLGQFSQKVLVKAFNKLGRKVGGKNRSKEDIEQEKERKQKTKGLRGRKKGTKNKPKSPPEIHIFQYDKKVGAISAIGGSSEAVAAALNLILHQFAGLYITTNLVEKEFSVLKELLSFRGCRDLPIWLQTIDAYYAIRDDPYVLDQALTKIAISSQTIRRLLPALAQVSVKAY
jgi:hypothetical protein